MSSLASAGSGGGGGGGSGVPMVAGTIPAEIQLRNDANNDTTTSRRDASTLSTATPGGASLLSQTTGPTTNRPDPDGWSLVEFLRCPSPNSSNNNNNNTH
jgi:hypothetical protein